MDPLLNWAGNSKIKQKVVKKGWTRYVTRSNKQGGGAKKTKR